MAELRFFLSLQPISIKIMGVQNIFTVTICKIFVKQIRKIPATGNEKLSKSTSCINSHMTLHKPIQPTAAIFRTLCFLLSGLLILSLTTAEAQYQQSLDLTISEYGLSFGNSERHTGLRFNYRDSQTDRIRGLNTTIWYPYDSENQSGNTYGVSLGLPGTGGGNLHGISAAVIGIETGGSVYGLQAGGVGLAAEGSISGITLGGLGIIAGGHISGIAVSPGGVISQSHTRGISLGGLANITQGRFQGIGFGGLGLISEGAFSGIGISGLGTISQQSFSGLGIGGLAMISEGNFNGVGISGLAFVTQAHFRGFGVGGLAMIAENGISGAGFSSLATISTGTTRGFTFNGVAGIATEEMRGIHLSALALVSPEMKGLFISPTITTEATSTGLFLAPAYNNAKENAHLRGISVSAVNYVEGRQTGLAIGIVNIARELRGVQIGLINYAGNNAGWARILPVVNASF